jgi:hypothetical protein
LKTLLFAALSVPNAWCLLCSILYLWYGVVCAGMGERQFGCEVGLQAAVICDRFHSLQYKGKCLSLMGSSIMPWIRPFAQTFAVLDQSWKLTISVGDLQWAGWTSVWLIHNQLYKGKPTFPTQRDSIPSTCITYMHDK